MIKSVNKRFILLIVLTTIYNFLFWHEKAGVNLVLFTILTTASVFFVNSTRADYKKLIKLFLFVLYAGSTVILVNSAFSIFSVIVFTILFTGYAHQSSLKSVYGAFLTIASGWIFFPYNLLEGIRSTRQKHKVFAFVLKTGKLVLLPVLIFAVFYSLYAYANPMFNDYSISFCDEIGIFISRIFYDYPLTRFIFICAGLFLITGFLYNNNIHFFADLENKLLNFLSRDKTHKLVWNLNQSRHIPLLKKIHLFNPKMTSLITEYRIGLILIIMVNLLILFLNIIDIKFLWFGFDSKQVDNLAYYVHEGAYVLIFSMLLSMCILLYLFRGNINFYPKNKLLKYLSYMWIVQNAIMAFSVFLRNYYYIEYYYALSYKRIGVFVFLVLVFAGLITMILKISQKRTTYNVQKICGATVLTMMLVISSFNWDIAIAEFNLSNPDKKNIDIRYILSLSDDVLPILDKNKNVLEINSNDYSNSRKDYDELEILNRREKSFMEAHNNHTFLSWNYPDEQTHKYLTQNSKNK